jgi:glycosyltransferase involved in cell wall biosynthesis
MLSASIILCTHNPRQDHLARTLEGLRRQTDSLKHWELLLADNASEVALAKIVDLSWHPNGRHVLERQLGTSWARRKGISESRSPLLIFVDDDNVLAPNYVSEAMRIRASHPNLGSFGGSVFAEFEVEPMEPIKRHLGYLAIRERKRPLISSSFSCAEAVPVGAGLCARIEVGHAYLRHCSEARVAMPCRKGNELTAHGDYEICMAGLRAGYEVGTFPELSLRHLIPRERISEDYFARLIGSTDYSGFLFDFKWQNRTPAPIWSPRNVASFVKNGLFGDPLERKIWRKRAAARIAARRFIRSTPEQTALQ